MSKLMEVNYQDIFPENLKKYKNLRTLSKKFEDIFKKYIISNIENLAFIYNLDLLDDRTLDEVAYYFNIDDYNSGLDREIKIKLINFSNLLMQVKIKKIIEKHRDFTKKLINFL